VRLDANIPHVGRVVQAVLEGADGLLVLMSAGRVTGVERAGDEDDLLRRRRIGGERRRGDEETRES
jgi:hypothetical protein